MSALSITLALLAYHAFTIAAPAADSSNCVGTISSLSDVSDALQCTTVNINGFTVPAGETFHLSLKPGTTVNVSGDVFFGTKHWAGPLFEITGTDITFNGNGHRFDGGGPFYWDGKGSEGSMTKPSPMMLIDISGTMSDVYAANSPSRCFAVCNPAPLTMTGITVDNSQGAYPNSRSDGYPAGANTDAFDVSSNDLIIEKCTVHNQDDCLAINNGTNIVFRDNYCSGGHGISIGSISSGVIVSDVVITGNTVVDSQQAFRIKTDASASGSTVSNVTYSGNTASGIKEYGVLITQSYPAALGTPGTGVVISDINFVGETNYISTTSSADMIAINCGSKTSCTGTWDWSNLKTGGGKAGYLKNDEAILGYYAQ